MGSLENRDSARAVSSRVAVNSQRRNFWRPVPEPSCGLLRSEGGAGVSELAFFDEANVAARVSLDGAVVHVDDELADVWSSTWVVGS